jgi:hypothetical protein
MISATDSARSIPSRWPLAALTLLAVLAEPGCGRFRSFRQETPPAFGTDTAWSDRRPEGPPANGDLYADLANKAARPDRPTREPGDNKDRSTANIAANDAPDDEKSPSKDDDQPIQRVSTEGPQVALQPPVTLPGRGENRTPALASRTESQPEPATRASDRGPAGSPTSERATLKSILAESRATLNALSTYQVKLTQQERVGGTLNPPEDVVLSIRRNPKAVRLEWPGGTNKGREVLYAADANGGLMHVRMGESLVPLPRLSMPPDSPLATRNSRHRITEAGFDTVIHNLEEAYQRSERADMSLGQLRYEGLETPNGSTKPCHKIVRVTPTNETWTVFIDPDTHFPTSVQAVSQAGELLDRFSFGEPTANPPELAKAEAFDPDARWGPSKGLFQRLARTGAEPAKETATR